MSHLTLHVLSPRHCLAVIFSICMAGNLRAELPPDAQEAEKKGIIAAKNEDYLLAIRYFNDARAIAPDDPTIYYDLGRAELKIPGRELRAICWFEAFLAANGAAPEAASVRNAIDEIDVKSQINLSKLIGVAKKAAASIPSSEHDSEGPLPNPGCVAAVGRSSAQSQIAIAQADAGDIEGAVETANLVQNPNHKAAALDSIVSDKIKSGDVAGALNTADLIEKDCLSLYASAHNSVARAQAASGRIADALKAIEQINVEEYKQNGFESVARIQARTRDIDGAEKTAELAKNEISPQASLDVQVSIVEGQAESGDFAGALNTAGLIGTDSDESKHYKSMAIVVIARRQAMSGDVEGALKTAAVAPDDPPVALKFSAEEAATLAKNFSTNTQAKIGTPRPQARWLELLDGELNTPAIMNLADQLESQQSEDPQKAFTGLMDVVRERVKTQSVVDQMLKHGH